MVNISLVYKIGSLCYGFYSIASYPIYLNAPSLIYGFYDITQSLLVKKENIICIESNEDFEIITLLSLN
jgi:hypothetical protein